MLFMGVAFGAGQYVGQKLHHANPPIAGVKSVQELNQMVAVGTGGHLLIQDSGIVYQGSNDQRWLIPDFAQTVNHQELRFLKNNKVDIQGGVDIQLQPTASVGSEIPSYLVIFGKIILVLAVVAGSILLFSFVRNRMSGQYLNGKRFNKVKQNTSRVGFKDVAGHTGPKLEVLEITDYLLSPDRFKKTGAKPPRGILLYGPPGNGKTLLAKAIAGEAKAAFIEQNASSFVQLFVGAGAQSVRDLFKEARKHSPCVVFIDEIDAIGGKRGDGQSHDERIQTLNALLAELDGFAENEGLVVIAATNRLDQLDEALIRPGRFDRKVFVPLPGKADRLEILLVHARNIPRTTADLPRWAQMTQGFSGADLANLVNEAAIEAARNEMDTVTDEHFARARDRILMGPRNHGHVLNEKENRTIAYHETGHAVIRILSGKGYVEKVSILPRGMALGVTVSADEEERLLQTKDELHKELMVLMGGRAAEEIFCGQVSTGASNDMQRASEMARAALHQYGFGDFGAYVPQHKDLLAEVERAAAEWVNHAYQEAVRALDAHRYAIHRIVAHLIEQEEIEGEVVSEMLTQTRGSKMPEPKLVEATPISIIDSQAAS